MNCDISSFSRNLWPSNFREHLCSAPKRLRKCLDWLHPQIIHKNHFVIHVSESTPRQVNSRNSNSFSSSTFDLLRGHNQLHDLGFFHFRLLVNFVENPTSEDIFCDFCFIFSVYFLVYLVLECELDHKFSPRSFMFLSNRYL